MDDDHLCVRVTSEENARYGQIGRVRRVILEAARRSGAEAIVPVAFRNEIRLLPVFSVETDECPE